MEGVEKEYVKRTQRDYSYSFKLLVVGEVERGELRICDARRKYGIQSGSTIRSWIEKYGNFDKSYEMSKKQKKSPEQELMELRQQVKLLERKNKRLEKELEKTDEKALFFDMMIDIAEEEFKIPIRKKSLSDVLTNSKQNDKKA